MPMDSVMTFRFAGTKQDKIDMLTWIQNLIGCVPQEESDDPSETNLDLGRLCRLIVRHNKELKISRATTSFTPAETITRMWLLTQMF